jgi:hypothetical protein
MNNKLKSDIKKLRKVFDSMNKCLDSKCGHISSTKELLEMQATGLQNVRKKCEAKSKDETKTRKCVSKGQRKYLKSDPEFTKKSKSFDACGAKKCKSIKNKINKLLFKK